MLPERRLRNMFICALVTLSMVLSLASPTAVLAEDNDAAVDTETVTSEAVLLDEEDEQDPAETPSVDDDDGQVSQDENLPSDDIPSPTEEAEEQAPDESPSLDEQETANPDQDDSALKEQDDAEASATSKDDTKPETTLEVQSTKATAAPTISYQAHIQNIGWQNPVTSGKIAGTSGRALRMEALKIKLLDEKGKPINGLRYKSHVQNIGWQGWVKDGAVTGTSGRSYRVEALKLELYGDLAEQYDVYYRVHVQNHGWLGWAKNGAPAGSSGQALRVEAIQIVLKKSGEAAPSSSGSVSANPYIDGSAIRVRAHVQNVGWQNGRDNGATIGTTGRGLRLEAFKAECVAYDIPGGIEYRAHVQNIGWQRWVANGNTAGTTGRSLRVEAVEFRLTGELAEKYDVFYRVHVQNYGWLSWTKNGSSAGTTGLAARVEAMQVKLVEKGSAKAPSTAGVSYLAPLSITYSVDVEGNEWQSARKDGATAGAGGGDRALEQLKATIDTSGGSPVSGGVAYKAHISDLGWTQPVSNGAAGGKNITAKGKVTSKDKGIEAVSMWLTGSLADYYDIQYRVYVDSVGWLSWAKNGSYAGNSGYGLTVRGIQVKLIAKGASLDDGSSPFFDTGSNRFGQLLKDANSRQRGMVTAANQVPSPGSGLCAAWITMVGQRAGLGDFGGDACDLYNDYCYTSDRSQLKVGMIVAVSRHNRTYAGSIYGHVAIYVGDGWVMDNVGYIRKMRLNEWVDWYGQVVPVKWGWLGNKRLG